jgi:N,N'-diacetyllegionaminate synthase
MIFIAEIGLNHNGNHDLAGELIKQAKYAGADIAKFQLGWRDKEGEINNFDKATILKLKRWSEYYDIELMFSIFNKEAFDLSRCLDHSRYKIASRTVIDNPELVKEILREGKETFLSLGMWSEEVLPFTEFKNVKYLWCKSEYPTLPWNLESFPKDFNESSLAGLSDHSMGIEIPLMAIMRGAKVIEKHFTLDKSDTTIRDHALSVTPDEFRTLVDLGRNIHRNLSIGI